MSDYTVSIQIRVKDLQDYAELLSWAMSRGEFISSRIATRPLWINDEE